MNSLSRFACVAVLLALWMTAGCSRQNPPPVPVAGNPPPAVSKPVRPASGDPSRIPIPVAEGEDYVSVVINDAGGRRVKNLVGMAEISKLTRDQAGAVVVGWDGRDEEGQPVAPGEYRVRGVCLPRLKVSLEYSFYNPGTPPWEYYPHSGWGSDHVGIRTVAVNPGDSGWTVALSATHAEGGDALFALDGNHRKVFGYKRNGAGAEALAFDGEHLYAASQWLKALIKFNARTGAAAKFQKPAGAVGEIKLTGFPHALAIHGPTLALVIGPDPKDAAGKHVLQLLDKKSGKTEVEIPLQESGFVAYDPQGRLHVSQENGGVSRVGEGNRLEKVSLPGLVRAGPMAIGADGRLYVMDLGPDFQVKVYEATGKLLREIGTKGGQGRRTAYDPQAHQRMVSSLAVDAQGQVWTVEPLHPRRQVVWGGDGRVVRQFIGCTQYGGTHTTLHEQDPTRAEVAGVLFRVDPTGERPYEPLQYLSSGPKEGGIPYDLTHGGDFLRASLFRSQASGTLREYLLDYVIGQPVMLLFVERNGDYRPCAGIIGTSAGPVPGVPGGASSVVRFWSDANADEIVQEGELTPIEPFKPGKSWRGGMVWEWTWPMNPELVFGLGGRILKPVRFLEDGTPVYDPSAAPRMKTAFDSSYNFGAVKVGSHFHTVQVGSQYFHGNHVFLNGAGEVSALFPYTAWSVHGSMQKPPPEPGRTSGELFMGGYAPLSGNQGMVMAWQGNYGQAFLFTEDGIFISTLFRDVRQNPSGYGETVVRGADWSEVSMQQEAFGGWFGRQDDGVYRYAFGRNGVHVVRVGNMDRIRVFDAGGVTLGGDAAR